MLVAQKKISYSEPFVVEKQNSKMKEIVVIKKNAVRMMKALTIIFLFLLFSFVILLRYTQINEYNQKINKLKLQLNELKKENDQLQVKLNQKIDLALIERLAVERLGMQYPSENQVVYLQLRKTDFTQNLQKEVQTDTNGWNEIWSILLGYLY